MSHDTSNFLTSDATGLNRPATAVILARNHPSGVAEPAQADELITNRLSAALALIDVGPGRSAVGA
jgi:hypothetical protein